jgi:hypothetical protein
VEAERSVSDRIQPAAGVGKRAGMTMTGLSTRSRGSHSTWLSGIRSRTATAARNWRRTSDSIRMGTSLTLPAPPPGQPYIQIPIPGIPGVGVGPPPRQEQEYRGWREHCEHLRDVRRQRCWDNGLGKLREALAHQFADFRRPEADAASGGWRWSVV